MNAPTPSALSSAAKTNTALELSELGAIGNQQTLALIALNGDIVHLSWPNLDDPTVFAPLLNGDARNFSGFRFEPEPKEVFQEHENGTNLLVTTFKFAKGEIVVTDLLPATSDKSCDAICTITRLVHSKGAEARMYFSAAPRSDYEMAADHTRVLTDRAISCAMNGRSDFVVEATFDLDETENIISGEVELKPEGYAVVSLGHRLGSRPVQSGEPEARDPSDLLASANSAIVETRQFWKDAIGSLDCEGAYAGTVERSMLTLAMLHMRRHGTLAAAGTFGFPESINGKRNWDYRYAWVRDSALVAETAARCGMVEEALGWVRSVLIENKSCDRSPLRLMMSLDGSDVDDETVLESWPGYLDSTPVQIGNEASGQLQLDIFGELTMALLTLAKQGAVIDDDMLARTTELLDWLVENWQRPDSSIWELRGSEKHYLFSRLMSWVAFRDGVALMRHHQREIPDSWVTTQSLISQDIEDNFWCPDRNCYMQTNQLPNADAAMIFMRVVGYLSKGDERWEASKAYLRKELVKKEGVLRFPHDADDGFEKNEGTFVLCTTWWIEALWLDGETEEAVARYERLLSRVGTTGIMAEELGEDGHQLGNLPQAFSHAGLISAALRLRDRSAKLPSFSS